MGTFISVLVIGVIIYLLVKATKKSKARLNDQRAMKKVELPLEIKVKTSYNSGASSEKTEKFNPIKEDNSGNWILNPDSPFELTVLSTDKEMVQQIRDLLDNDEIYGYKKENMLVALFAEYNFKIKEIEEYKSKYRNQYLNKIQEQKEKSSEWAVSGEKDKVDMMLEFRQLAINDIYERANCDLEILFETDSDLKFIAIDDELINEYGFENIQTYVRYADKLEKVRIVKNDDYSRPMFEKLAEQGLADRGKNLPKYEILTTLTLKDLNAIAEDPSKEYKRKNQAIEYILSLSDMDERIGKYVSMREIFKLRPLPDKYSSINLQEVASTWNYHAQEVRLLMDTFRNSFYTWKAFNNNEYVKEYTVEVRDNEYPCPCALSLEKKKFSKNNPPRIPYHIGCSCFLNKEYNFD